MIGLYSCKSLCDELNKVNNAPSTTSHHRLMQKYHSTELILDVDDNHYDHTRVEKSNFYLTSLTSPSNSSSASSTLSLSNDDTTPIEFLFDLFNNLTNTTSATTTNTTTNQTSHLIQFKSTKKNLDDLIEQYSKVTKLKKTKKIKFKKRPKSIDVTKELVKFKIKRNYDNEYLTNPNLYSLNSIDEYDEFNEFVEFISLQTPDDLVDSLYNTYNLAHVNLFLTNRESTIHSKQSLLGSLRPQRTNKKLNLKYLLKHKINLSNAINFKLTKQSLTKSNVCLHVKYNVQLQIDYFVKQTDRFKYKYSNKQIDKRHQLDEDTINTNKLYHKQIELAGSNKFINESNLDHNQQLIDPPVVVNYSIDHNRVNNELNQTYDQLYLEFLISLQHREITPEDYEYLSRLDELVKKKTVNDNILNRLKSEQITESLLARLVYEQCGICLDGYVLDQTVKYLPCGHLFHLECIDSWLRNQSTDCPLDKLPVDGVTDDTGGVINVYEVNSLLMNSNVPNEVDEDVMNVLNELCDRVCLDVEFDNEITARLDELVNDVCVINQVENYDQVSVNFIKTINVK